MDATARLLITCPDRPGIIANCTNFLLNHGANITGLDQHATEAEGGTFFMRVEFQLPDAAHTADAVGAAFASLVAEPFDMDWRIADGTTKKKMAVMVSKGDHALLELLWRWRNGEIAADITGVISNHPDLENAVETFGIPFHHIAVTGDSKADAEARQLALLEGADLVVLARYMQILSPSFVGRFPARIINIHHSFLPAFAGARPYHQAWDRGVKVIGATAHYVTEDLDEGPIIEQDVERVSHRHSTTDLVALGRDIERQVLARAVRWHLEDRVIVWGNKTVVFS